MLNQNENRNGPNHSRQCGNRTIRQLDNIQSDLEATKEFQTFRKSPAKPWLAWLPRNTWLWWSS